MMAKYSFDADAVRRISKVVHDAEQIEDAAYAYNEPQPASVRLRIAKTAGADWAKGTYQWLVPYERKDPAGGDLPVQTAGGKRFKALNLFGDVPGGKWVVCAPTQAGIHVVIAAEC